MTQLLQSAVQLCNRWRSSSRLEPRLPDNPKHQFRIEPLPGPRGDPKVIEVVGYLAAIQTVLMELLDAVYEGLMGRVEVDQRQRLGLD